MSTLGIVAIGRNEGERFKKCVESFSKVTQEFTFVYVDSGSTDGSVQVAKEAGVGVVELDTTVPFTAARARNAGVDYLSKHYPNLTYIQFVDGDCQIAPNWLTSAIEVLEKEQDVAVVCGRRKEINPQSSTYNALIDLEWNTPIGYNKACGGDALYRASAFLKEGGFNGTVIAGEEPELCYRLRQSNWKIKRIDADMTYHDAALTKFSQWWKRAERYGHAATEGFWRYGTSSEKYELGAMKSILIWGAIYPGSLLLSPFISIYLFILLIAVGLFQFTKLRRSYESSSPGKGAIRAQLTMLCKLAEFKGMLRFFTNKIKGKQNLLIEYK
ncbi:MAG: glycosyl transferase [Blastomonas sp.]|nr:glycosyl transferase [Blastomonas sp.]|tara:strand:- start:9971 stop:10954 length:984 start_codon:yes stop_codon:yes gene_type:complete